MKKKTRDIEVFNLSALDLFASAMGAFVLLSVMMLPYFFKGKGLEEVIERLQQDVTASAAQAGEAEAAARTAVNAARNVTKAKSAETAKEARELAALRAKSAEFSARIDALRKEIEREKQKKVAVKPDKGGYKVSFRLLGLKTNEDRYLILIDGAARIKRNTSNLPRVLTEVVSVFGPAKEFAIAFYRHGAAGLLYERWPKTGFVEGSAETRTKAVAFMKEQYEKMSGRSATYQALERAVGEKADAVIFISDGFISRKTNLGRGPVQVIEEISGKNSRGIQVNSVAVGVWFRNPNFADFMNQLRLRNGGDFKGVPP